MRAKPTWILALMATLTAGCELAGALIAAEVTKGEGDMSSATLSLEIESASGTIAGQTLAPEMLTASGTRFDSQLTFDIAAVDGSMFIQVMTQAESSSTNPYNDTGRGGGSDVLVCNELDVCRSASDFGIDVVQTGDGQLALVDSFWGEGDTAELGLIFREE